MHRATAVIGAGLVVLGLAACGTTVPQRSAATRPATGADGGIGAADPATSDPAGTDGLSRDPALVDSPAGSGPGAVEPLAAPSIIGTTPAAVAGTGPGSPARVTRTPSSSATRPSATRTPAKGTPTKGGAGATAAKGGAVRGVTATTITIGVTYPSNAAAANSALGVSGVTRGDQVTTIQLLVDDINKRGGIKGRKLLVLFRPYDAQSTDDYSTQAEADCTYWTQDQQVFAVFGGQVGRLEGPCFEKAGVPFLQGGILGDADLRSLQLSFAPLTMSYARALEAAPRALTAGGWFGGWDANLAQAGVAPVKVGVLSIDVPTLVKAVQGSLLPGLKAAGHAPDPGDVVYITQPGSSGGNGAAAAAISNAVLKFRQDGVTHVVLTDANGSLTLLFSTAASSQQFYPRYGGTSGNGIQALLDAGALQPKTAQGAVVAGWLPVLDLPFGGAEATSRQSDAAKRCFALMAAGDQTYTDANAAAVALASCDLIGAFAASLGPASAITGPGFAAAYEALGSGFAASSSLPVRMGPGRHESASSFLPLVYSGDCQCMTYRGSVASV